MTTRGEQTRERLLDVAEELLGKRGIDGVSMREIRIAAGQRNTSALQFHFGDRQGLLRALSDRHGPRLQAMLVANYERMIAECRENDGRTLIGVFVRPTIDYVFEGPSERSWIRILAELAARPELAVHDFTHNVSTEAIDCGTRLLDALERTMPRQLAFDRIFMVTNAVLHVCADRSRVEDSLSPGRRHMSSTDFTENIVDMAHSALFAPVHNQVDSLSRVMTAYPELGFYTLAGQPESPRELLDEVGAAEALGFGSAFISERFNVKEAVTLSGAVGAVTSTPRHRDRRDQPQHPPSDGDGVATR